MPPTPPNTTARVAPSNAELHLAKLLEVEIASTDIAETRLRTSPGALSWSSELRID